MMQQDFTGLETMKEEASTVADPSLQPQARTPRIAVRFTSLPTGTRLGHYVVQEAIGTGGFGITYRAEHITLRNKSFALKEFFPRDFAYREGLSVHPTTGGEALCEYGRKRFLKEAEALALCTHPAIVDVVDYFEGNGTAYAVLEYIPGMPWSDWLGQLGRRPTQAELDAIAGPVLDALEVVHSNHLLHRDIAPDNIIIRPDGMPCLIDFGAARADMGRKAERTAMIVKHGYSPPEQHLGDAEQQGHWTDIYAFGATLYRAITGAPPPDAMQRANRRVPMPVLPAEIQEEYRPGFLRAIHRSLELDINQRPQSVGELRSQLMTDANARPSSSSPIAQPQPASGQASPDSDFSTARDAGTADIAQHPLRRIRGWIAALALLGLGGGFVAAGQLGFLSGIPGARLQQPSTKDVVSPPTSKSPSGSGGELAPGYSASSTSPPPASTVANSAPDTASATPVAPVPPPASPQAPTVNEPDNIIRLQQECSGNDRNRKLAACMALVLAVPATDVQALYRAQVELGRARRAIRETDQAITAYDEAIKLLPNEANAYNHRAIAKIDKRDLTGALEDLNTAIQRNASFGEALNNRAWVLLRLNRAADGLPDANAAVRLQPEKVYVWDTRAQINRQLGNNDAAIADYREALKIDPDHKSSLDGLRELGGSR